LKGAGFEAVRTDQVRHLGDIVRAIRSSLRFCDCALAVLTDLNPNVMYELGLAHAQNKPVTLMAKRGQKLPFDIKTLEVIWYKKVDSEFEEDLALALAEVSRRKSLPETVF
jgi:nucleoside 2-deoxyribosyltransferase